MFMQLPFGVYGSGIAKGAIATMRIGSASQCIKCVNWINGGDS
jgi:hypothetical protein